MFPHTFSPFISQLKVQDQEKEDAFPLYFEDMMTGHWAGSYYRFDTIIHHYLISSPTFQTFLSTISHTWSKMLAADIFSAYTEAGLDNPQVFEKSIPTA